MALAASDPDLAHEGREVAAALAAGARGDFGLATPPDHLRAAAAGLLRGYVGGGRQPALEEQA